MCHPDIVCVTILTHRIPSSGNDMWPNKQDAIEMNASFLIARHGSGASPYARKTACSLKDDGDHEGHLIWNEVADKIEHRQYKVSHRRLEPAVQ
jgi:hypothetical protein